MWRRNRVVAEHQQLFLILGQALHRLGVLGLEAFLGAIKAFRLNRPGFLGDPLA